MKNDQTTTMRPLAAFPSTAFDAECALDSIELELRAVSAMAGMLATGTSLEGETALAITGVANAIDGVIQRVRREGERFHALHLASAPQH
jgi:hypothetical protein